WFRALMAPELAGLTEVTNFPSTMQTVVPVPSRFRNCTGPMTLSYWAAEIRSQAFGRGAENAGTARAMELMPTAARMDFLTERTPVCLSASLPPSPLPGQPGRRCGGVGLGCATSRDNSDQARDDQGGEQPRDDPCCQRHAGLD